MVEEDSSGNKLKTNCWPSVVTSYSCPKLTPLLPTGETFVSKSALAARGGKGFFQAAVR